MKKAIIAGASGLIGSELLKLLLESPEYQEVLILVRREIDLQHPKLIQLITDYDKLETHAPAINGHTIFCCLGTTKSQTPNERDYRKIDHDYPVKLAEIAKTNKIDQYHLVSSIGADMNSKVFYTRLKGETENAIAHIGLPCVHIYQPSVLVGNRAKPRPMEKFIAAVMKVVNHYYWGV